LCLPWRLQAIGEAGAQLVEGDPHPSLDGAERTSIAVAISDWSSRRSRRVDGLALLGRQLGQRLADLLATQL